jgi:hypothetical protein
MPAYAFLLIHKARYNIQKNTANGVVIRNIVHHFHIRRLDFLPLIHHIIH